jgi:hypothetical protein
MDVPSRKEDGADAAAAPEPPQAARRTRRTTAGRFLTPAAERRLQRLAHAHTQQQQQQNDNDDASASASPRRRPARARGILASSDENDVSSDSDLSGDEVEGSSRRRARQGKLAAARRALADADSGDDAFIAYDEENALATSHSSSSSSSSNSSSSDNEDEGTARPRRAGVLREETGAPVAAPLTELCRCGHNDALAVATYRGRWLACGTGVCGTRQHARCYGLADTALPSALPRRRHVCDACLATAVRPASTQRAG